MNTMKIGGIAAGMFAAGLLAGLAGTAVARDTASTADCTAIMAEHMSGQDMSAMMSMMGGAGSMMGGAGSMMGGAGMPSNQHWLHHPAATPGTSR
jgi:hypothetical protein